MQKYIDRPELQIRSAIALDHLKNFIYVEADKEAHVKEVYISSIYFLCITYICGGSSTKLPVLSLQACKGLRNIFSSAKVMIVPIKEMTDVLSVESKAADLARDTWVRMKLGVYKGDLAKVYMLHNFF